VSVQIKRRRFTLDDVRRMIASGIVREDERIELIDGEIVEMAAMGGEHFECVMLCNEVLTAIPDKTWYVSVQSAIQLAEDRAPQPDLALVRRRDYRGELPGPADVFLLIDVSDATDRRTKVPLYAAAGIPEVWIVDVKRRRLTLYSDLQGGKYALAHPFQPGDMMTSIVLPAIEFPVDAILPRSASGSKR
jgi:Uma2 family endonuclease